MPTKKTAVKTSKTSKANKSQVEEVTQVEKVPEEVTQERPQVEIVELYKENLGFRELVDKLQTHDLKVGSATMNPVSMAADHSIKENDTTYSLQTLFNQCVEKRMIVKVDNSADIEKLSTMIDEELLALDLGDNAIMPSLSYKRNSKFGQLVRLYIKKQVQSNSPTGTLIKYLQTLGKKETSQTIRATVGYCVSEIVDMKIIPSLGSIELGEDSCTINGKVYGYTFFMCPSPTISRISGTVGFDELDDMFAS